MASASAAEPLCLGGLLRRVQSMRDTQLDLSEKKAKRGLSILITGGNGVGKTELLDALVECCKLSREPSDSTLRAAMAAPDRALISALPGVGTADERMHLLLHSGLNTVPSWVLPFKMLSGGESARIMTALQLTQGCTAFDNFGCCPDEQSANMAALAASRLLPPGKLVVFATHTPRLAQFLQPDHVIWILEQSADSPPAENRYILINNPNGTECGRPDVSVQLVPPVDASGPFDKEPPYQPYIGIRGGGSPATAGPPHVMTAAVTRTAFTALVTLRTSLEFNGTVKKRFFQLPAEFSTPWRLACMVGPSGSGKSVAISRLSNLSSLPEAVWDGSSVIDVLGGSSELVRSRAAAVGLSSERWSRRLGQLSSGQQAAGRMAYALQPFDTDEDCTVAIDEAFSWHDVDSAAACAHTLHAFVQARGGKIKLVLAGAAINHPLLAILQPDWVFNPSKPAYRSLHIFTEPADQPNFVAPRSVVPFAEVLFRRYAFSGMARKCHSDKAHQHWDQFKGCARALCSAFHRRVLTASFCAHPSSSHHYLSGEMPKDAFSNLFLLRDDATGQAVGMNAYGVHVGKTSAADPRK